VQALSLSLRGVATLRGYWGGSSSKFLCPNLIFQHAQNNPRREQEEMNDISKRKNERQ
jgi:hypothetical protein